MAGFLSLPSKELAQERRRNCKPLLIAASGFITGLIYPIFAFRHRNIAILYSWLAISAFIVVWRQLFEVESSSISIYMIWNFIIYSKYGAAIVHFLSILLITTFSKDEATDGFLKPFINEKDAFPLKVRKTTSILKNIFDINNEEVKDIYETAKPSEGGLPSIEDLNRALIDENLEPVQFCKKDGLKIIPEKLRANFAKSPNNNKKISTKKTKVNVNNEESTSFSESFKTIITYGGGGLIGVFVIRAAKEILSN